MRKTVDIETIIRMVNYRNRESICNPEIRKGWNSLISEILTSFDTYAGFRYLDASEVPENQDPGIAKGLKAGMVTFPDDSRIKFFLHDNLKA